MSALSGIEMPLRWLRRLPIPNDRIGHLVLSAFLLATANTFGSSLAAARFLSTQGGEGIAIYYIVFALVSIPAWAVYARMIDSGSRVVLLQRFMAAVIATTALLILASGFGGTAADYSLYTGISVLESLLYSVFHVVLIDYLTAREMTRYSTRVAVALSAGGMVGGSLAGLLAGFVSPFWLLFGMPLILCLCLAHLAWLSHRWKPAGEREEQGESGILENLRSIGSIMRGFLIAVLLSTALFLNIVTQCIAEYMVFNIYTDSFPDEQSLAKFFGLMSGALNFVGMAIGLWLTDPLMRRLGIARMNLVFPAACAVSFIAMLASPLLPVAMFAHVVYDGLSNNIDAPVTAINYNAVPGRFASRLRAFNDSLIYPIALAVSGLLVWVVAQLAGLFGVGVLGVVLSLCFLACGWGIGWRYVSGLVGILREGAVDLDRDEFLIREASVVAASNSADLTVMLKGQDKTATELALRIVAHTSIGPFIEPIAEKLATSGDETVIALARGGDRHAADLLTLWPNAEPALRIRIAQYLVAVGRPLPEDRDQAPVMIALDLAARLGKSSDAAQALVTMAQSQLDVATALLPVAAARREDAFMPMLVGIIRKHASLEEVLVKTIAALPYPKTGSTGLPQDLLEEAVRAPDTGRRVLGYQLAVRGGWPAERIAVGLTDRDESVRRVAIAALVLRKDSVAAVLPMLRDENPSVRLAAIEVLGHVGATEALFSYLQKDAFPRIARYRQWRQAVPDGEVAWAAIARIAMAEANQAAIDEVLVTLAALGHKQTVSYIRRFLSARDERMRARAAEAITAVDQRRLVTPLIPLLDGDTAKRGKTLPLKSVLDAMSTSSLPWLRRAAVAARSLESDMPNAEHGLLDRLLFLRNVPIFESCSLDDLYAMQQVMKRADYLSDEVIVKQGAHGEELFVLLEGEVKVRQRGPSGFTDFATLKPGSMFGEMALFGEGERSADIVAVGYASCLVLERSHFEDLARQRPGILLQICRVFGGRLRAANQKLHELQTGKSAKGELLESSSATQSSGLQ